MTVPQLENVLDERGAARLAKALGWFSIGLGVAQLVAPRRFARLIGSDGRGKDGPLVLAVGLREIAAGVGLLVRRKPAGWMWARVAGAAMDLALLGAAMNRSARSRSRLAAATAGVAGVAVPDLVGSMRLSESNGSNGGGGRAEVRAAITVNRPRKEAYAFWRDFENLPRFMAHLDSVQSEGERRSHWRATAPGGRTVEWDAEITDDRPSELISWRSLENAEVANAGTVRFEYAPGGRGTEIHVEMRYDAPGGGLGAMLAKLFGEEPTQQVKDDLRRFKQVLETGEIPVSEGSPEGVHARRQLKQRPAQPIGEAGGAS